MQALENLIHQEVTLEYFLKRDVDGEVTYQEPVIFPCRVSGEEKEIRDDKGRVLVSKVHVTILGDVPSKVGSYPGLDARARVTLPYGCIPQQPPIMSIGRYPDMDGCISHTTIHF